MTGPGPASAAGHALAVDAGSRTLAEVEHLVHEIDAALAHLPEEAYVVSTHVVRDPAAHLAAVVGWTGVRPDRVRDGLLGLAGARVDPDHPAVPEHRARAAGRLARYPGRSAIERRLTAAEVVGLSCVDAVEGLAGTAVRPDSVLDLTGFARPTWRDGRCTLLVQQARDGVLLPFEVRDQVPCCANH